MPVDEFGSSHPTDYVISPGDVISVKVFQQDAVSTRGKVRVDGMFSLPLVNELPAAGRTPTQLAVEISAKLKAFINNPVVTVALEEPRPLTVSVLGEVTRPGVTTLESGAGVMEAIAAAGGITDFAHLEGLFVLRRLAGKPQPIRIRFTWEALSRGEGAAGRFQLQPGDVVVVE
ncbi:MAG: polysaccharide biosynthesis/export family protein [Archangiaceae bacterium]|nr:polysaccharide biosynthesis/export family protein [Archangiaceae bacterium]